MKVAVIGANGQLGTDVVAAYIRAGYEVVALTHKDIEITDQDDVRHVLATVKPAIIINTAAFHNVPICEKDQQSAYRVNAIAPQFIAQAAEDLQAKFIQYSTDYVFDGTKKAPYLESDYCNPLNVYGISKLAGESMALNYCSRCFVIRISGIYGKVPSRAKGGNFITTMLKLAREKSEVKVVTDEVLTPTPTSQIAFNTLQLSQTNSFGLYHMTSEGHVSWYEFARVIWDHLHIQTPLYPTSVHEFAPPVKRPFYSVLENQKLKTIGCHFMNDWKSDLINHLNTLE